MCGRPVDRLPLIQEPEFYALYLHTDQGDSSLATDIAVDTAVSIDAISRVNGHRLPVGIEFLINGIPNCNAFNNMGAFVS